MADKNFVCTICSQTFTRMWRGKVHIDNLHGGQGEIVRMIDYMVGRLSGLYAPSNPSDYRKKNSSLFSEAPKGTLNPSPALHLGQTQEAIIKTARLKEVLDRYFPSEEVQEILRIISYSCLRRGNNGPLDKALKEFSKVDEVRRAQDYLGKS
jgi:hypothetical protein